jgi:hypothetical protein
MEFLPATGILSRSLQSIAMNESRTYTKRFHWVDTDSISGVSSQNDFAQLSWADTRSGVENPSYRDQIRRGVNASTPFTGTKSTLEVGDLRDYTVAINLVGKNRVRTLSGSPLTNPFFRTLNTLSEASADSAALGKFYSSARSATTAMQGMTFLGEIAETIRMLKRPASSLQRGIGEYLERLKKISRHPSRPYRRQALAGTYLEYAFGWVPLISDTRDAAKALNRLMSSTPQIRCTGFGQTEVATPNSGSTSHVVSLYRGYYNKVERDLVQVIYRGAVKGSASGPTLDHAMDLFGFRLDEVVPTAWELLPWSFLADYFSNVGEIVSATFYASSNFAWCNKTVRRVSSVEYTEWTDLSYTKASFPTTQSVSGSNSWVSTRSSVVRGAATPSVPSFRFELPGSNTKWVNIAALALQSKSLARFFL